MNGAASDDELISRFVARGDESAFRELYRRHTPAAFGLLCRLTGGQDADAADLMQAAWVRAVRRLSEFRGASAFRTWLSGIAVNCYREWRRAEARRPAMPDSDALDQMAAPVDLRADDIAEVVRALPLPFRDVLVLHDIEGWTHDEIAHALGIEPGTSKSRLSRARALFRKWWRRDAEMRIR